MDLNRRPTIWDSIASITLAQVRITSVIFPINGGERTYKDIISNWINNLYWYSGGVTRRTRSGIDNFHFKYLLS